MTPATGICRTCQRPAGEVPFNGMTLYGHIDPPHPSHRVRFVRLSRSGQPSASVPARGNAASTEVSERSYEDAPGTSPDPAPGRVAVPAQSGHSRVPTGASTPDHSSSAGRARRVGVRPPAPAPRPARSAGRSGTAGE